MFYSLVFESPFISVFIIIQKEALFSNMVVDTTYRVSICLIFSTPPILKSEQY